MLFSFLLVFSSRGAIESNMSHAGKIIQVIGPVVDVEFPEGTKLPKLLNALEIDTPGVSIVAEVARHLEPGRVRAVALSSTDGLTRGTPVKDTGAPISVPVGSETLGNLFDVLGNPLDAKKKDVKFEKRWPIHRPAPRLEDQSTKTEVFETGIKVIDLLITLMNHMYVRLEDITNLGRKI